MNALDQKNNNVDSQQCVSITVSSYASLGKFLCHLTFTIFYYFSVVFIAFGTYKNFSALASEAPHVVALFAFFAIMMFFVSVFSSSIIVIYFTEMRLLQSPKVRNVLISRTSIIEEPSQPNESLNTKVIFRGCTEMSLYHYNKSNDAFVLFFSPDPSLKERFVWRILKILFIGKNTIKPGKIFYYVPLPLVDKKTEAMRELQKLFNPASRWRIFLTMT